MIPEPDEIRVGSVWESDGLVVLTLEALWHMLHTDRAWRSWKCVVLDDWPRSARVYRHDPGDVGTWNIEPRSGWRPVS